MINTRMIAGIRPSATRMIAGIRPSAPCTVGVWFDISGFNYYLIR